MDLKRCATYNCQNNLRGVACHYHSKSRREITKIVVYTFKEYLNYPNELQSDGLIFGLA